MNSFAVVTDSAADIPLDLAREFGIKIVPLHVAFQGKEYNDGVDISTPELLRLMDGRSSVPVITKSASGRKLPRDARECFELNARAHDLFVLGCPAVAERRGGGDWRAAPKVEG